MTLRAGAANLAVGPVAARRPRCYYAEHSDRGLVPTAAGRSRVALAVGAGASRSWWSASTCPAGRAAWSARWSPSSGSRSTRRRSTVAGEYDPTDHALLPVRRVRRAGARRRPARARSSRSAAVVGRFRPVGDPAAAPGRLRRLRDRARRCSARPRSPPSAACCSPPQRGDTSRSVAPSLGLELTGLALGAALVGGTSAFGRRGGVFGTLLGVTGCSPCSSGLRRPAEVAASRCYAARRGCGGHRAGGDPSGGDVRPAAAVDDESGRLDRCRRGRHGGRLVHAAAATPGRTCRRNRPRTAPTSGRRRPLVLPAVTADDDRAPLADRKRRAFRQCCAIASVERTSESLMNRSDMVIDAAHAGPERISLVELVAESLGFEPSQATHADGLAFPAQRSIPLGGNCR